MKLSAYLLDHKWMITAVTGAALFTAVIVAVRGEASLGILLGAVIVLATAGALWADYIKRRNFYDKTMQALDALERKSLLSEMVEEPDFLEGGILTEILAQCAKSMNDQIAAVQREAREYREYVETWMHEIKTPLAGARLILTNHPDLNSRELSGELDQMEALLEQALYYARSAQAHKDYVIHCVDLREIVNAAIRKQSRLLIGNQVSVEPLQTACHVYTDAKWISFILSQIIINCVQYRSQADAKISFWAVRADNSVFLTIRDNGIGIDPRDLPRVFEKGFTGDTGRKYTKSTGIGLYLCKKLCGKLGVGIRAESEVGEGTSMILQFPISEMTAVLQSDKTVSLA